MKRPVGKNSSYFYNLFRKHLLTPSPFVFLRDLAIELMQPISALAGG